MSLKVPSINVLRALCVLQHVYTFCFLIFEMGDVNTWVQRAYEVQEKCNSTQVDQKMKRCINFVGATLAWEQNKCFYCCYITLKNFNDSNTIPQKLNSL
jgi:hypothetical protein